MRKRTSRQVEILREQLAEDLMGEREIGFVRASPSAGFKQTHVLSGDTWQSSNFVAGTSGWRITADGVAEFQSLTANGFVQVGGAAADVNANVTTISGGKITANTITADRLNVATLSAISADLGTVTAGMITGATIRTAAAAPNVVMSGSGIAISGTAYDAAIVKFGDAGKTWIAGDDNALYITSSIVPVKPSVVLDGNAGEFYIATGVSPRTKKFRVFTATGVIDQGMWQATPVAAAYLGTHDMVSNHSYVGGAALDLFGLTAASTIGKITPSSNPGAAASVLATTSAGLLTLAALNVSGNVGIGTTSPLAKLNVYGTGGVVNMILDASAGINFFDIKSINGAGNYGSFLRFVDSGTVNAEIRSVASNQLRFATGGTESVIIDQSGSVGIGTTLPDSPLQVNGACHATSFPTTSDVRFKQKVQPIRSALAGLRQIGGVSFEWNKRINDRLDGYKLGKTCFGFIAQEVEKVFPEVIHTWFLDDQIKDAKGIDFGMMTPIVVEAVKELDARLTVLERKS